MNRMVNRRDRGFTLIEMLIVIVILAILAAIVIPQLMSAGRRAKEATLRGNLGDLRVAIAEFRVDCGDFPWDLAQLNLSPEKWPKEWPERWPNWDGKGGTGEDLDVEGWDGPYLKGGYLPLDLFTGKANWNYNPETGEVHSKSTQTANNGEAYSSW